MDMDRRSFLAFTAAAAGAYLASGLPGIFALSGERRGNSEAPKLDSASIVHFSPTGSTAKIAKHLGGALSDTIEEIDISGQKLVPHSLNHNAIAVVAVPVYMGRVPARAVEALRLISGNGAACVSVVVFGNRAFDDALIELNDVLAEQAFRVFASGAFIAQHALTEEIAAGRPDADDRLVLDKFSTTILATLASGQSMTSVTVPGNRPYITLPPPKITPIAGESCVKCGLCAKRCPVSAISPDALQSSDAEVCITCMRCVRICPVKARALPAHLRERLHAHMQNYTTRLEPTIFMRQ